MEELLLKEVLKDQIKKNYIKYIWGIYKMTVETVFDNNGEEFFKFMDSIDIREELPKVATEEYLKALKEYSKVKDEFPGE